MAATGPTRIVWPRWSGHGIRSRKAAISATEAGGSGRPSGAVRSRAYQASDRLACLAIFDSNLPIFFAAAERDEFGAHLDGVNPASSPYLVLTDDQQILACGGLWIEADQHRASLSWGMVDRRFHRGGLGARLLMARLALARATPAINEVILNTSQHTQRFYARFGFEVVKVTPDGLAAGLDRWDMRLRLGG